MNKTLSSENWDKINKSFEIRKGLVKVKVDYDNIDFEENLHSRFQSIQGVEWQIQKSCIGDKIFFANYINFPTEVKIETCEVIENNVL